MNYLTDSTFLEIGFFLAIHKVILGADIFLQHVNATPVSSVLVDWGPGTAGQSVSFLGIGKQFLSRREKEFCFLLSHPSAMSNCSLGEGGASRFPSANEKAVRESNETDVHRERQR